MAQDKTQRLKEGNIFRLKYHRLRLSGTEGGGLGVKVKFYTPLRVIKNLGTIDLDHCAIQIEMSRLFDCGSYFCVGLTSCYTCCRSFRSFASVVRAEALCRTAIALNAIRVEVIRHNITTQDLALENGFESNLKNVFVR